MKILREPHDRLAALKEQNKLSRKGIHISIPDRPSTDRIEHDLITGLTVRLDAFAEDAKIEMIDLATDQIDLPIVAELEESMDETRNDYVFAESGQGL
jgi:hypothetical protein